MSEIEFLVKLRDAAQMIADAAEEYLEGLAPVATKKYDQLNWTQKEGRKGPYQQTSKAANNNSAEFRALQYQLKGHNGFWQTRKHKYWLHRGNPDIIDRRQKG